MSTKSEDRRRVIEEASGIVKFKVRKEEAERKLNSTEQNLVRIDDILNELSERIGPLKEQSEKAIEYHKTYESLKEKDIALLVKRIDDANTAMGDSGSVKEKLEAEIKEQEDRYIEFRENNSELTRRSEELDDKIEDKRQELSDVTEQMHDTVSDIKINEERLRQLNDSIANSDNDEKELKEEIERLRNDYSDRVSKADELLDRANNEKKNTEEIIRKRDDLLEEFKNSERSNDSIRKSIESKTNELLDTKEKITSASAQINAMEDRLHELGNNRQVSAGLKTEMENNLKEADKAWREMMEKEGEVTSDITSREDKLKDLSSQEKKLLAEYEIDNRSFITDKARLKSLQDLEARKEGYQESVRRLFAEVGNNSNGIVGVIGDLISTRKEYETAIEIALASAIHNVVTKTEKNAADLIDVLKTKRLGRVTFLPIENIKPRSIDRNVIAACERKNGYIGVASDLVENPKEINDIVENLLGKILICETMSDARTIAREASHSVKVITLEGDCINAGGSLTGGSVRRDSSGILGRAREIEDLKAKIVKTEQKLSVSEAKRQELDEQTGDLRREIDQLNEQLKYFAMERVKAESEYRNVASRLEELENGITDAEKLIHEISAEKLKLEDDLEELSQIVKETEGELSDYREDIVRSDNKNKEFTAKLDELRDEISRGNTESERILAERNGVLNLASHIKDELSKAEAELNELISDREKDASDCEALKKTIEEQKTSSEKFKTVYDAMSEEIRKLNEEKTEIEKERSGFVTKLTEINDGINALRDKYNNLVSKYERYINDIDFSKNRLWEDYETTYDNVVGKYPEIESINETTKLISSLKNKIKNLGPVNMNSIEEYKEISERYEFMMSQRNDIVDAKTNLEKVIADLIDEMKTQFIDQFTTINENFKTVFTDLFNGGSAEIVLENEEDVLNCGIEIKAQPPGKKLQSLTLLSGGERCLTAIALLFAILQLRPSPFVILDEVEAALDDVNVSRFTDFVRRYCVRSQFILVTHRKGTMEACDRMYGVTMQERGISKILSMRIQ